DVHLDDLIAPPAGAQRGDAFPPKAEKLARLSALGEGISSLRTGRRGDQIIQVNIKTPTHLNKKQEALLKEFAKLEKDKLGNKLKNILKSSMSKAAN
ncbi:MAG: hypothetical protein P8Z73_07525, partial [Desulfobacteraceae bacterium]